MHRVVINVDGKDGALSRFAEGKEVVHLSNDSPPIHIVTLDHGMTSGLPSAAIAIDTGHGKVIVVEISVKLFQMAAAAMLGKYGDLTGSGARTVSDWSDRSRGNFWPR